MTSAEVGQGPRSRPTTAPILFGVALIGLGGTAAIAAQTAFTLAQSASIWLLVCAGVTLVFLIGRALARR
ncbi:MAG: hypothetical protein ACR2QK_02840 [Acidimicrobiales bacterium]